MDQDSREWRVDSSIGKIKLQNQIQPIQTVYLCDVSICRKYWIESCENLGSLTSLRPFLKPYKYVSVPMFLGNFQYNLLQNETRHRETIFTILSKFLP